MQKAAIVFFLLVCSLFADGQHTGEFNFTHYSTSTGLLSNQVNSVVQDETGYIWIGTTDGLVRFDGVRYKVFRHRVNDSSSISVNPISQLLIDNKKNLWLLMADGHAGIFNTQNFRFREARVKSKNEAALKTGIKKLLADGAGNIFLLIGTIEIITWNEESNEFAASNNFFPSPGNLGYTAFAQEPGTQKYWMGLQGGGIAIYNRATGQLSYPGNNIEKEPVIDRYGKVNISCNFLFDSKGRVWFSDWGDGIPYVQCYDIKKRQPVLEKYEFFSTLKDYNEVGSFFEQKDGTIWVTGLRIFGHYLEKEKKFALVPAGYSNERSIDYRIITSLYEDRENNIWTGTANNGLFIFNPSQSFFTNIPHPNKQTNNKGDGNPLCFFRDKDGTLLTGIWGEGLYRYDKNFNSIPVGMRTAGDTNFVALWSVCPSRDSNTVWMGAQPGLYAYDQKKRTATYYTPPALGIHTVRQVGEDKNGNLWLGMQAVGVFKWDALKGKHRFEEGLSKFIDIPDVQINFVYASKDGYIWVCTRQAGVYVIDPDADTVLLHFHKNAVATLQLPEDNTTAVLEYNDSLVVIAGSTHIILYNRVLGQATLFKAGEMLSGFIMAMQKDNAGNLWVSTTSALYRLNIDRKIATSYNRDDGITSDFFIMASSYKLPDGKMLFGAAGQFVVFDPALINQENRKDPGEISITDFKVMNKPLLVDSLMALHQIVLENDESSLAIEFSQLSFTNPLLIQYKLDGIDKDWNSADLNNQAVYSYLPPGNYKLSFRTVGAEGTIKDRRLALLIEIKPPFWKAWWFYALLGLFASTLIYWFDREWMKRKAIVQKMRSDIAGNLHEEVNTALSNINILSEMALMKSEREPEKSKEFIKQIHTRSHNMIIAMDDMLWSISPDNDNMDKTVERMREYMEALANRHGINIELLVDKNIGKLELNMRLRHEAFMLFKEGIQSLVTAGVTDCAIQIALEKNQLLYTMQFGNAGCDMQQLNNLLQRQDMEKHMSAINASLDVQVHKTSSLFIIQVPLD